MKYQSCKLYIIRIISIYLFPILINRIIQWKVKNPSAINTWVYTWYYLSISDSYFSYEIFYNKTDIYSKDNI